MRVGPVRSFFGAIAILALLFGAAACLHSQSSPGEQTASSASSIPQSQLLQPEELKSMLYAQGAEKPLVLQVGSHVLFAEAHIRGSEYAGPGSQAAGLKLLQDRVSPLSRKTPIVIYCGCCPWSRCPNMGPAYKLLTDLGFTRVKALYVADNLGTNWVDKGYPVDRGR